MFSYVKRHTVCDIFMHCGYAGLRTSGKIMTWNEINLNETKLKRGLRYSGEPVWSSWAMFSEEQPWSRG